MQKTIQDCELSARCDRRETSVLPTHGPETYLFLCFPELCSNYSKKVAVSRKLGDVFGYEHMVGAQFSVSHLRRSRSSRGCSQEDALRRIWAENQEEVGLSDQKRMRKQARECHCYHGCTGSFVCLISGIQPCWWDPLLIWEEAVQGNIMSPSHVNSEKRVSCWFQMLVIINPLDVDVGEKKVTWQQRLFGCLGIANTFFILKCEHRTPFSGIVPIY